MDSYIHQYTVGNYIDRREAVIAALKQTADPKAIEFLKIALNDKSHRMRRGNLMRIDLRDKNLVDALEPGIVNLAKTDPSRLVKAQALMLLGNLQKPEYAELFKVNLYDSSYSVAGAALKGLSMIDKATAMTEAKKLANQPNKSLLKSAILEVYMLSGSEELYSTITGDFKKLPWWEKLDQVEAFSTYLSELKSADKIKKGVDLILETNKDIPDQYRPQTDPMINGGIQIIIDKKSADKKLKAELEKKLLK